MEADHQHGYLHAKDAYLKRLRRIEGQARGLQRARGAQRALRGGCGEGEGGDEAEVKLKKASDAIARLVRS